MRVVFGEVHQRTPLSTDVSRRRDHIMILTPALCAPALSAERFVCVYVFRVCVCVVCVCMHACVCACLNWTLNVLFVRQTFIYLCVYLR